MKELTVPDVIHRVPPLVVEAARFLRRGACGAGRKWATPRVVVWRGPRRGFGAVYPGSFDPWTLAHESILRAALRRVKGPVLVLLDLDTVDKPSHEAPLAERLAILALHLADERRVAIGVSTHGRFLEKVRALGRATFVVGHDTWERVQASRYYDDPGRELAELRRRARFLVAPRGSRQRGDLPLSPVDQARSATLARRAFAAGRLPWDQLAPDVLLACWQLRLYDIKRLMPIWVVTAFLGRDGNVLLVKRGQRVGTYKGAWSGVSGYLDWPVRHLRTLMECGPGLWALRQVKQEIREETGIRARSIRLLHAGREIAADDPAHCRQWRVRPFLFRVAAGVEPTLDWENTASTWIPPWIVLDMKTVPRLDEALGSALGGWRHWCEAELGLLVRDRTSGSMAIAGRALAIFSAAHWLRVGLSPLAWAKRLARAHPMGVLTWIRDQLARGRSVASTRRALWRQDERLLDRAIVRLHSVEALGTYSRSLTVYQVVLRAPRPVIVFPDADGHGRRLARDLREFADDVRVSRHLPREAVLVLGCDAVLPDRSIINARGTTQAIREAGLPVIVLAQRCKFIGKAPPLRRGFERVPAGILRGAEFITG